MYLKWPLQHVQMVNNKNYIHNHLQYLAATEPHANVEPSHVPSVDFSPRDKLPTRHERGVNPRIIWDSDPRSRIAGSSRLRAENARECGEAFTNMAVVLSPLFSKSQLS